MSEATYKLHYFNLRARGELSRLIFAYANKHFEDVRYSAPNFGITEGKDLATVKASGLLPFGQVPVLEVTTGGKTHVISQSHAIERYLAREFGLYGSSNLEAARIDEILEALVDVGNSFAQQVWTKPREEQAEALKKFVSETLPKTATVIDKFAGEHSDSAFCCGKTLTLADLALFHTGNMLHTDWKDFPNIHKSYEAVGKALEKYLAARPNSPF
eukprot:TRINITY_DN509_c0_g1_i8.p1 TRINITY_DN509_c0_g1~~TRINITY_DN509_c0_g1_i8.p1  ORF type:complete len:215 (-),score=50.57 TRINITY_DN509_c0_g1_i8:76-720(-)